MYYTKPIFGFLIFFFYGCILNLYILIVYGFDEQIPDSLQSTWFEPMSLTLLVYFTAFVYGVWVLTTKFGTITPDVGSKRKLLLDYVVIPAEYTTTNIGIPMLAFVLGSSCVACFFSWFEPAGKESVIELVSISIMITAMLSALYIIRAYVRNFSNKTFILFGVFFLYVMLGSFAVVLDDNGSFVKVGLICFLLPIFIIATLIVNMLANPVRIWGSILKNLSD